MDINFSGGVPLPLGLALAKNSDAMRVFTSLPPSRRLDVIERASTISSKKAMRDYVESLVK